MISNPLPLTKVYVAIVEIGQYDDIRENIVGVFAESKKAHKRLETGCDTANDYRVEEWEVER